MTEARQIPFTTAQEFARQFNFIDCLETSAKENNHVDEAFMKLAKVTCA